jgi:hypothetical protein
MNGGSDTSNTTREKGKWILKEVKQCRGNDRGRKKISAGISIGLAFTYFDPMLTFSCLQKQKSH